MTDAVTPGVSATGSVGKSVSVSRGPAPSIGRTVSVTVSLGIKVVSWVGKIAVIDNSGVALSRGRDKVTGTEGNKVVASVGMIVSVSGKPAVPSLGKIVSVAVDPGSNVEASVGKNVVKERLGGRIDETSDGAMGNTPETPGRRVVSCVGTIVTTSEAPFDAFGSSGTVRETVTPGARVIASVGTIVVREGPGIRVEGSTPGSRDTVAGIFGNSVVNAVGTIVTVSGAPPETPGSGRSVKVAVTPGNNVIVSVGFKTVAGESSVGLGSATLNVVGISEPSGKTIDVGITVLIPVLGFGIVTKVGITEPPGKIEVVGTTILGAGSGIVRLVGTTEPPGRVRDVGTTVWKDGSTGLEFGTGTPNVLERAVLGRMRVVGRISPPGKVRDVGNRLLD